MRKLILVFLITLIAVSVSSQGDHFIYIQADNHQAFYVRSGSKTFRSSGEGYLVIPGLLSNNYELIIGFPDVTPVTEWRFQCTISETDLGFILRSKGSNSPELVNLGEKNGISGTRVQLKEKKKEVPKSVELTGIVSDDPFSRLLADVVNDPTIRQQPIIIEKKTEPVLAATADSSTQVVASVKKEDSLKELTTKAENKTPVAAPAKDSTKTAVTVPVVKEDKPFVVKETTVKPLTTMAPPATISTDTAYVAKTVPVKQDNQPFVVKEIKKEPEVQAPPVTEQSKPVINSAKPKEEPFVVKELPKADTKTTIAVDSTGSKKPAPVATQSKNEPFVVKELPKPNDKTAQTSDSSANKKTLPFTVQPKEKPIAVKETTQPEEPKNQSNILVATPENKTTTPPATQPKEDKPFVLKETVTGKNSQTDKPTTAAKNVVTNSVSIKKTLQRKSIDGIELIYVDEGENGVKDTIRILIPGVK